MKGFDKRGGRVSGEVGAGIYASHEMYSMTIGVGEGGRECKGWLELAGGVRYGEGLNLGEEGVGNKIGGRKRKADGVRFG